MPAGQILVLKEVAPSATVITNLYTTNVSAASTGTVFCMNKGETDDKVSVALVRSGNVISSNSYICFQTTLPFGHSLYLQQLCLGSQDSVRVVSQTGNSTFIFSGQATG